MPDATTTETVTESEEQTTTDAATTETIDTVDYAAEAEKWKALSRQNEARAKENAEAAKRLKEIEDAQKSEAEKAAEALAELKRENESLRLGKLRSDVAAAKGVPVELLNGTTEDELNASADAALAWLNKSGKTAAPADKQGLDGKSADRPAQLTAEQLKALTPEQRVAAHEAGQLADLLGASK